MIIKPGVIYGWMLADGTVIKCCMSFIDIPDAQTKIYEIVDTAGTVLHRGVTPKRYNSVLSYSSPVVTWVEDPHDHSDLADKGVQG